MNIQYAPKKFCNDYAKLKGSNQLPMFIAVVKGIKPLMDDWIPAENYQKFKKVCAQYGLKVEPDWVFIQVSEKLINKAIDSDRLSTTKFCGKPYSEGIKSGEIHVFISKSEEYLKEAHKFGWYPLIVNGRSLHKPFIDHMRFGKVLGFPDCCINFFKDFNDHNVYNHLYETYKNTEGKPNFLCNSLFMDFTYSLIHHIPCSYNCKKTIKLAKELLIEIEREEPEFSEEIKHNLKLPLLAFEEKNIYAFEGKIKNNMIHYSDFSFLGREQDNKYQKILEMGDNIAVKKDGIDILKESSILLSIPKKKEENGFLLQFK